MDTNDSNIKPQQTGGLKLMTVFIAVLALHVVVIGGFTVYHLMSGGSADADLTTTDKIHKGLKGTDGPAVAEGALPDANQGEKNTSVSTPPTEVATIPAKPLTPAPDQIATTEMAAPASVPVLAPAPALTLTTPKSTTTMPPIEAADQGTQTPSGPISLEPALAPMASGPVHMPEVATPAPASQQIYVVKITDSYKKIAHAHHITVAQLKEANHIKTDLLHTGQKLVIPTGGTAVVENAPVSVPALDSSPTGPILSESTSAPTASLAAASPTVATSASHHHLYTVVKGDTLIKIAHKFKTTAAAIMTENSITDPSKLAIGKKLKISSQESRSAKNSTPASTQPGQVQAKENAPTGQLANFVP